MQRFRASVATKLVEVGVCGLCHALLVAEMYRLEEAVNLCQFMPIHGDIDIN